MEGKKRGLWSNCRIRAYFPGNTDADALVREAAMIAGVPKPEDLQVVSPFGNVLFSDTLWSRR